MIKYRAVVMVPTVIEFEGGPPTYACEQVKRLAKSMGSATSIHPRRHGDLYEGFPLECVNLEDEAIVDLNDYVAPGVAV